ncbi:uncharacterized protein LOC104898415 [Beta vulgaris subsp. vulgaris]|uniref:uncharacterized protein LOC104898415 n=1 Tax=Beta vulgaris subsp. vulgaris TaxID=3555 RepID=UPI00053FE2C0|nr:uncharacterized protein LOC104898415 [Beta vulgaris subsp. vulgaris]
MGKVPFAEVPPQQCRSDDVFIPISEVQYTKLIQPWNEAIICKVVGKSFSQEFLSKEMQKLWPWKASVKLISLSKGFYNLICDSATEKARILVDGPWFIIGSLIWVQPWQAGFKPSLAAISHYPIWISLPELSLEFFCKDILHSIGNSLGSLVKIDAHSLEGDRKRFASVCVLMKANQCVPGRVWVGATCHELVYSDSPWLCHRCRKIGHNMKRCPLAQPDVGKGVGSTINGEGIGVKKGNPLVPAWVYVGGKNKNRKVDFARKKERSRGPPNPKWKEKKMGADVSEVEREKVGKDGPILLSTRLVPRN